jgi:hypothetical protein
VKRLSSLITLFVILAVPAFGADYRLAAQSSTTTQLETIVVDPVGRFVDWSGGMPPYPDPVRPIPRHEPGRPSAGNNDRVLAGMSSRAPNLEQMLANGTLDDPLQGNYRLVQWDQILLARADEENLIYQETSQGAFPDPEDERLLNLGDPEMIAGSQLPLSITDSLDEFALASGDFNADGLAEQITAWTHSGTGDTVHLTVGEMPGSVGRLTSDPEAVARSGGLIDLFSRGYDDALWYRHYDGAGWGEWQGLGGTLVSGPAAAARGADLLDVFALGTDGEVYTKTLNGSTWSGWQALPVAAPAGVRLTSSPAAVSRGPNRLDLFVRASDNTLWHLPYDGGWGSWQNLGGLLTSSPAAVAPGGERLDVFGRGVDSALWTRTYDGNAETWGAWNRLSPPSGSVLSSDPAAVSSGAGMLELFVRASDDALWHISYAGGSWSAWESLGGELGSGPGAVLPSGGETRVYAQTIDGTLMETTYSGSAWSAWSDLGGLPPCCVDYDTGKPLGTGGELEIETGYFLGNQRDQIVVATEAADEHVELVTYRFQDGFSPVVMGVISTTATLGGYRHFDLTTGDLDGDGLEEIGLTMTTGYNSYRIQVFDVDPNGVPVAGGYNETVDADLQYYRVALVAGDYTGDGKDDLVRGYSRYRISDGTYKVFVGRAGVSEDLSDVGFYGGPIYEYSNNSTRTISFAAGDVTGDRRDEIVVNLPYTGAFREQLLVFAGNESGTFSEIASSPIYIGGTRDNHVLVGDLNRDLVGEIVLLNHKSPGVQILDVYSFVPGASPPLGYLELQGSRTIDCGCGALNDYASLALGDVAGGSLRVGKPVYRRQSDVGGIIAVINRPPTHKDVLDGVTYDINSGDSGTYAAYETAQMTRVGMSLQVSRDWGLSAGVETTLGDPNGTHVTASLNGSYGEHFEETTTAFETVSFGTDVKAENDDIVYYSKTDYDVWEYPVYDDNSRVPTRQLAVTFPVPFAGNKGTQNAFISGTSCDSWYRPNHQINNVWSYPKDATQLKEYDDARGILNTGDQWDMASSSGSFETSWGDETVSQKSSAVNVGFSAGLEAQIGGDAVDVGVNLGFVSLGKTLYTPSIKGTFEGYYDTGSVATHEMSGSDETTIRTVFASVDNQYGYKVTPYLYWSEGGYLVLDYITQPTAGTTFWGRYTQPDPAFILPWADGSCGPANVLRSGEIEVSPPVASSGDEVTIKATVRNLSNVQADGVTVRFFLGDPASGGSLIGETQVPALGPRARQTVSIDWTASGRGEQRVFAVIDPDNTLAEMHDETDTANNNKAYAYLDLADAAYVDPGLAQRSEYEILTYAGAATQQTARVDALSTTNGTAMETSVYIPVANLGETMRFELNPGTAPSGVAGYLIDVAAYIGDELQAGANLKPSSEQPPAAVAVRYSDADIAGMDENQLRLFRGSGGTWQEATCAGYQPQRLPGENLLVVPVCQTGTFALADEPPASTGAQKVYLPALVR